MGIPGPLAQAGMIPGRWPLGAKRWRVRAGVSEGRWVRATGDVLVLGQQANSGDGC
jgi:hypothetical protein